MLQAGLIQNAHSDLVTDASYDFYGLHLATSSLDQRIKVWLLDDPSGNWTVQDDWKAHDAAISKLSWAHPEFGTVLASGSFDRTVKVWEQTIVADADASQMSGGNAGPSGVSRWAERATFAEAKGTVRGVEFAPHYFGLKLATISSDNNLRIYECREQPSLTTWQLLDEIDVVSLSSASTSTSCAPAPNAASSTPTQPAATLEAVSASLAPHAAQQQQQSQVPSRPGLGTREADGGWCISWCKDRYWGEVIAAGCGINGVIKVIQLHPSGRAMNVLTLDPSPTAYASSGEATARGTSTPTEGESPTPFAITSVAWAPSCGRSYHLVATGGRDGHVRIWRVKPPTPGSDTEGDADAEENRWSASVVADFDDHKSAVGRVEWNVTGTILSSAGNDGRVRLWKMTAGNVWRPAGHISVEQAEEEQVDVDMDDNAVED